MLTEQLLQPPTQTGQEIYEFAASSRSLKTQEFVGSETKERELFGIIGSVPIGTFIQILGEKIFFPQPPKPEKPIVPADKASNPCPILEDQNLA